MSDQSTFWSEEHLAKISQSLVSEPEWMEIVVNSPLSSLDLLRDSGPDGWSGRTSPVCCRLTEDERLEPFSESWGNSGMGSLTEFLTLNTAEFHSEGVGSSLSDILETGDAVDGDVGKTLRAKNPDPHYKQNHHQWLKEFGRQKVHDQIERVITIMKLCTDMNDFRKKFAKVFKKGLIYFVPAARKKVENTC